MKSGPWPKNYTNLSFGVAKWPCTTEQRKQKKTKYRHIQCIPKVFRLLICMDQNNRFTTPFLIIHLWNPKPNKTNISERSLKFPISRAINHHLHNMNQIHGLGLDLPIQDASGETSVPCARPGGLMKGQRPLSERIAASEAGLP